MAISFTNLDSGNAGSGASVATDSVTLTSGRLCLLTVVNTDDTLGPDAATPTCSGWTEIHTIAYFNDAADSNRLTLFRRLGNGSTGAHTIDFGGASQQEVLWSIEQSNDEVDTSGTNASNAIVQAVENNGTSTSPSATLSAFSAAANATFGAFGLTLGSNSVAGGGGFSELATQNEGGAFQCTLFTQYRADNDTSVDCSTGGSAQWGAVAIEVKALSGSKKLLTLGVG